MRNPTGFERDKMISKVDEKKPGLKIYCFASSSPSLPPQHWTRQWSTICFLCFGATTLPGKAAKRSKECSF